MKNIKPRLYILPGWGEKITQVNYRSLIKQASKVYMVVPIKLPLFNKHYVFGKNGSFVEFLNKAKEQIKRPVFGDTILGFSIGALIAYKLATKIKFKQVVICSISPILERDLLLYPPKEVAKIFTPRQVKELNKLKYGKSRSKTIFFYGSLETKECIKRSKSLTSDVAISVDKAKHSLTGDYLKFVKELLLKN